ncbi:MAG TPA: rRNA maturation RNase YbeY, partial [Thermodesulfobacteriota bacterium]|nr:rRNA maturation RNase YbeY [Thermodesulfobacteriota bacterium]
MKITVSDRTGRLGAADKTDIKKISSSALKAMGLPAATELSLSFIDDRSMRELNRQWRNIDRTTDVLSFPQEGGPDYTLLGDIVISVETAERQSARYGNTLREEIMKLIVHGALHLVGHDHKKRKEKEAMRKEEVRIMLRLK